MAQNITSGYGAYLNYGYEATYGTPVSGTRVFGHGQKITISRKNNMERVFGLGSRNSTVTVAKQYEGSASIEFIMSNGGFFRGILGTVADAGATPFTHTYTETNTIPSMSIVTGEELGTNDSVTVLAGAKISSATITCAVNELVKVRLECPYKSETQATSGIGSQVAEAETPFTFAQGTLALPSGSTIGNVQNVELTVSQGLESVWGLGSRIKTAEVEKQREYNIKMTVAFSQAADLLTKFYGQATGPLLTSSPAATATLVLTFTNGESGSNQRSIVMTFANIYLDNETLPKDATEIIKEDVEGWALSCTSIVYSNNTEIEVGSP